MDIYFEEFKKRMKIRMRIPKEQVTRYFNDIFFFVDSNNTFVHEVKMRIAWLQGFDYEFDSDLVNENIVVLLKQ